MNSAAPIGITDCVSVTGMSTVTSVSPASACRIAVPCQASTRKRPRTTTSRTARATKRAGVGIAFTSPGKAMWDFFNAASALP